MYKSSPPRAAQINQTRRQIQPSAANQTLSAHIALTAGRSGPSEAPAPPAPQPVDAPMQPAAPKPRPVKPLALPHPHSPHTEPQAQATARCPPPHTPHKVEPTSRIKTPATSRPTQLVHRHQHHMFLKPKAATLARGTADPQQDQTLRRPRSPANDALRLPLLKPKTNRSTTSSRNRRSSIT